ncbi:MAG: hypothetical protein HKO77_09860 [Gemmatimonadetes bacterium]|nr:hypothetical protein [Gemmatimonadota bacterium]NNL31319.1 hypothetical protein [Gemmatimonadota bacterium]
MTDLVSPIRSDESSGLASPDSDVPEICVLIPVLPGGADPALFLRRYSEAFRDLERSFEILVLLPSSNPLPPGALGSVEHTGGPVRVLQFAHPVGETGLLSAALNLSDAPWFVVLPSYASIRPEAVRELVDTAMEGADVVTARRLGAMRPFDRLKRSLFHGFLRLGPSSAFKDLGSGVRVIRRSVFEELPLYGDVARFLPLLAESEGFRVVEQGVEGDAPTSGASRLGPGVYLRRLLDALTVVFLLRFTEKPLRFFGLVGATAAIPGGILLSILFVQRMMGQPLADRPILLLAVLLSVLGVQAIALGLIGEIIVHLNLSRRRTYRVEEITPSVTQGGLA